MMVSIKRLEKPQILKERADEWTQKFLARVQEAKTHHRTQPRPNNRQYAHKEIVKTLQAMSFQKCFYCETLLNEPGIKQNVDHYIEVSEQPELAFEWENLYLSCVECNEKVPNMTIPCKETIDPCDTRLNFSEHMTFDDEFIAANNGSELGLLTIQKYQLNRMSLNYARKRALSKYATALISILRKRNSENKKFTETEERELLKKFATQNRPFSAMFRDKLRLIDSGEVSP